MLLLPLLLSLGFWQLDRADQKAGLQAEVVARGDKPAINLNRLSSSPAPGELRWREAELKGRYIKPVYLLDNQVLGGEVGYRLYTPVVLTNSDRVVLVERDWLPLGPDRTHVPDVVIPGATVELSGRIVAPPSTGIMLAEHRIEPLAGDRFRIQRIDLQELSGHAGQSLEPYIVRLHSARHAASDEAAALEGFGRERHLGYAFQWFALATTLVLIFLWVNIKRRDTADD